MMHARLLERLIGIFGLQRIERSHVSTRRAATAGTTSQPPRQIERILSWIGLAMAMGILILAVQALGLEAMMSGWRFFGIGSFAALAAAAFGGALGLLFGLPISAKVVVVNQTGSAGGEPGTESPRGEWFSDNTSIEQIADWLTKIIVGLALTQWRSIQEQFDRLAAAVSAAMAAPVARAVQGAPDQVACVICPSSAALASAGDAGKVAGGLILATYGFLGFLLVYLWARRYLSRELAAARGDMRDVQKRSEMAIVKAAQMEGGLQDAPKTADAKTRAESAVASAAAGEMTEGVGTPGEASAFPHPLIAPGHQREDPWNGQFGGSPTDGKVEVRAQVQSLKTVADLYMILVVISGVTDEARAQLKGTRARVYLHPTFRRSIRLEQFDSRGRITFKLVGYGAFTLGVQLEDGRLLELDLALLPGAPQEFKDR